MSRYNNTKLFHGTNGNRQMSIEQMEYFEKIQQSKTNLLLNNTTNDNLQIDINKQNKHIKGSNKFVKGKSEITISLEKCQELINKFIGSGEKINNGQKERVDFKEVIGNYIDTDGKSYSTTIGIIHKSSTGCHIVPARPKGDNNDIK